MGEYRTYPFMLWIDVRLWFSYFFVNPYRALRKDLQKKGVKNPYQYGETPLSTLQKLISEAGGLQRYQYFADLGSGRGRLCVFVKKIYRCRVFGIERFKLFVDKSRRLFPSIKFVLGNFLDLDISSMDLIYLYGTMMTEKEILAFTKKVSAHTRVITISYPLNDYDSRFKVLKTVNVKFPWGETKGYIQCLRR